MPRSEAAPWRPTVVETIWGVRNPITREVRYLTGVAHPDRTDAQQVADRLNALEADDG